MSEVVTSLLRKHLDALYGERLYRVMLFGSRARGDASPDSDIDVMIVLKGDVDIGAEIEHVGTITSALSLEYDVVISCVFVSFDRFSNEHSPLLINVHREGVFL